MAGDKASVGTTDLEAALAALRRDYSKLSSRIRVLEHTVSCECDGVALRLHFPSFRQGQATVAELTDAIVSFLIHFALPRKQVAAVDALYGNVSQEEFLLNYNQLSEAARNLFKRANETTNLPAKNIFMCAPEKGRTRPLESTDFWNLSGRAGRLQREFQGSIFLIDYASWKKKPLDGPKDVVVAPAIEKSVKEHEAQLLTVITDKNVGKRSEGEVLETAFGRLFSDHKKGELAMTLGRLGILSNSKQYETLSSALIIADGKITIPADVVRRTPSISAHKQQRLFDHFQAAITEGTEAVKKLIPRHPRESEAFQSYADILELCYDLILGIDTSKGLHRFHAVIALKWMLGVPLPQIVDVQIKRSPKKIVRTTIRETLELIETQIRFQAVRLFGCYNTLLIYALDQAGMIDLVSSIPALPLYLEVGASDKTMISFISLGFSRVTAMKLNELSSRKDLDVVGARQWLRDRPLETLGLSSLLLEEVRTITAANA